MPFYAISGFYVYKEGQSVCNYIEQTYGHEKVLEILRHLRGRAARRRRCTAPSGFPKQELYEQWSKSLRKHYWPLYPDKEDSTTSAAV